MQQLLSYIDEPEREKPVPTPAAAAAANETLFATPNFIPQPSPMFSFIPFSAAPAFIPYRMPAQYPPQWMPELIPYPTDRLMFYAPQQLHQHNAFNYVATMPLMAQQPDRNTAAAAMQQQQFHQPSPVFPPNRPVQ